MFFYVHWDGYALETDEPTWILAENLTGTDWAHRDLHKSILGRYTAANADCDYTAVMEAKPPPSDATSRSDTDVSSADSGLNDGTDSESAGTDAGSDGGA